MVHSNAFTVVSDIVFDFFDVFSVFPINPVCPMLLQMNWGKQPSTCLVDPSRSFLKNYIKVIDCSCLCVIFSMFYLDNQPRTDLSKLLRQRGTVSASSMRTTRPASDGRVSSDSDCVSSRRRYLFELRTRIALGRLASYGHARVVPKPLHFQPAAQRVERFERDGYGLYV